MATTEYDSTHECPAPHCKRRVAREMFACRAHWYQLPKHLRDNIWDGYRNGDAYAHSRAMKAADDWYLEREG